MDVRPDPLSENTPDEVYAAESIGTRVPLLIDIKLLEPRPALMVGPDNSVADIGKTLVDTEKQNLACVPPYGNIHWRTPGQDTYQALLMVWLRLFAMQFNAVLPPIDREVGLNKPALTMQAWRFFRQRTLLLFQRVSEAGVRWIEQSVRDAARASQLYDLMRAIVALKPTDAQFEAVRLRTANQQLTEALLQQRDAVSAALGRSSMVPTKVEDLVEQVEDLKRQLSARIIELMMPPISAVLVPPLRVVDDSGLAELRVDNFQLKAENDVLRKRERARLAEKADPKDDVHRALLAALGAVGDGNWTGRESVALVGELRRRMMAAQITTAMPPPIVPFVAPWCDAEIVKQVEDLKRQLSARIIELMMPPISAVLVPPLRVVDDSGLAELRVDNFQLKAENDVLRKRERARLAEKADPKDDVHRALLAALGAVGDGNWTGRESVALVGELRRRMMAAQITTAMPPPIVPFVAPWCDAEIDKLKKHITALTVQLMMPPVSAVLAPPIYVVDNKRVDELRAKNFELAFENKLLRKHAPALRDVPPDPREEMHRALLAALGAADDANWTGRADSVLLDELRRRLRTAQIAAAMPPVSAMLAPPIQGTASERDLRTRITELQAEIKTLETRIAKYARVETDNTQLKADYSTARAQLANATKQIADLQKALEGLPETSAEMAADKKRITELVSTVSKLTVELNKCKETAKERPEAPPILPGLDAAQFTRILIPALMPPITGVLTPPIVDTESVRRLQEKVDNLTADNGRLQKSVNASATKELEHSRTLQKVKQLEQQRAELEKLVNQDVKERIPRLEAELTRLRRENAEIAGLKLELSRTKEQLAASETDRRKLQTSSNLATVEELREQVKKLTEDNKRINKLQETHAATTLKLDSAQALVAQQRQQLEEMQARLDRELPDAATRDLELRRLRAENEALQASRKAYLSSDLQKKNAELENERDMARLRVSALKKELSDLQKEVERRQANEQRMSGENDAMIVRIGELEATIAASQDAVAVQNLKSRIDQLREYIINIIYLFPAMPPPSMFWFR